MNKALNLNEGEFIWLLRLNQSRQAHLEDIERRTENNSAARSTQLAELQAEYEQALRQALVPTRPRSLPQLALRQPSGG